VCVTGADAASAVVVGDVAAGTEITGAAGLAGVVRGAAEEAGVPEPVPAREALPSGAVVLVASPVVPVNPDGTVVATITPSALISNAETSGASSWW
jgi:hypothetical protein